MCRSKANLVGGPPELLRASHIIPWAESKDLRLNPSNGLCLSATFDAAFDCGLISLDDDYRLILGSKIESFLPPVRRRLGEGGDRELEDLFLSRRGQQIILPEKNLPSLEALKWHRSRIGGRRTENGRRRTVDGGR